MNVATKNKNPHTFKKYLISENAENIKAIDKKIKETEIVLLELQSVYMTISVSTTGMIQKFSSEIVEKMVKANNVKEFIFDLIMKGKTMVAGNNFPISRDASLSMFAFHPDTEKLGIEIEKLKILLNFLDVFGWDSEGFYIDEIKRTARHERERGYTETEKIARAYELALKISENYNQLIELSFATRNGNCTEKLKPFDSPYSFLEFETISTPKGLREMVKVKGSAFVDYKYYNGNNNLTDLLR